ncbi:MAG: GNAT family N-acetyltransferase [Flavobacteriales bacterium]|nr:GNAT family N-acetyltransferase [Flavobacteriales bacterium]
MNLIYQKEENLNADEFQSVLIRSTLGARRPVDDIERLGAMVQNANLVITARDGDLLVGVARGLTDFCYCTYLSDLAVDEQYQNRGIGKQLIREVMKVAPQAKLILLSAPAAVDYYPKLGMERHPHCFTLDHKI